MTTLGTRLLTRGKKCTGKRKQKLIHRAHTAVLCASLFSTHEGVKLVQGAVDKGGEVGTTVQKHVSKLPGRVLDSLFTNEFGQHNKKRRAEVALLSVPDKKVYVNERLTKLLARWNGVAFKDKGGHFTRKHVSKQCKDVCGGPLSGKNFFRLLQRLHTKASLR